MKTPTKPTKMSDFLRDLIREALAARGIELGEDPQRGGNRRWGDYVTPETIKTELRFTPEQYAVLEKEKGK